ncbi:MAG: hypothetical protein HQ536_02835 [Parcubacteria group bacterium]|nr:hypothetical protein [Parcubacteria group bacterium]
MKKIKFLKTKDPLKEKRAKQDQQIERELRKIYMKDGKMPNFTKFDHEKKGRPKVFLIGIIAFLAVLAISAWAGFFILKPYEKFGGKGVQFKIEGPKKITSGKEIDLELHYLNNEGVPLGEASISLLLTPGFVIKESNPEQIKPGEWNLGSLEKGEEGKIEIKGVIVGGKDDKATLTGSLMYRPANFNSEFEKVASYTAKIDATVLGIEAKSISEAAPGEEIEYIIKYRNLSAEEIQDIAINPALPEEFIFATSTPERNKRKMWYFEKLEPEEEGEIILKGSYSSEISGGIEQEFQAGFVIVGDKFVAQEEVKIPLTITKSDLILTLLANGSRGSAVNFGDTIRFLLSFKNDGEESLEDIELKVIFDPLPKIGSQTPLNWGSLRESNGATKSQYKLVWNKDDLSRLDTLRSGDEGTIDFSVDLIDSAISASEDHIVSVWVEATVGKSAGEKINRSVQSTRLVLPVNSNLIFQSFGRYFDDDGVAIGAGPIPPRVGETTSYKIFWRLANSLHDLENTVVSATLPAGVLWQGGPSSEQGSVEYDEISRKVTWRIDSLSKDVIATEASFSVSVTPESSDAGDILAITNSAKVETHDKATGGVIIFSRPNITTGLLGDPEAEGRGTVIEL